MPIAKESDQQLPVINYAKFLAKKPTEFVHSEWKSKKIDLSISSIGKDILTSSIPMFRTINYNDKAITNNFIADEYLLNFDLIVDDLEEYNKKIICLKIFYSL